MISHGFDDEPPDDVTVDLFNDVDVDVTRLRSGRSQESLFENDLTSCAGTLGLDKRLKRKSYNWHDIIGFQLLSEAEQVGPSSG